MNNKYIPQTELQKLASNTMRSISLHSLGQWVKVQTDSEYIIINRMFVKNLMDGVAATQDKNLNKAIASKWCFEDMMIWL
jgi:hypothetical protein